MIASTLLSSLSMLALAAAKSISIDVGEDGFTFEPNTVTADVGDQLEFHFYPSSHSATSSDFSNPCNPSASGGFSSGFIAAPNGEDDQMFVVTINNTDPLFFYCAQVGHCMAGMFGVVNPSGSQTLAAYTAAVKSVKAASAASGVFGGQLVANIDNSSSSEASSATSSASSTGTGTATAATTTGATTTGATTATTSGTATTTTAGGASTTSSAATSASSSVVPSRADESIVARGRAAAYVTVGMVLLSAFVAGLMV